MHEFAITATENILRYMEIGVREWSVGVTDPKMLNRLELC